MFVLWENGGIDAGAIARVLFFLFVMPVAPSLIAGWVCGKMVRGVSISGGLALGAVCGIAMAVLQPDAVTYISSVLGVHVSNGMYLATPVVGVLLTVAVCFLWAMIARRLGRA